jgi:multiple sugar transport system permease protein
MLLLVGGVVLYPFVHGVSLAFTQANLLSREPPQWIGFANFARLLQDPLFAGATGHSVEYTLGSVAGEYLVGLGSAMLLASRYFRDRHLFRALVLLPWVVPIAVNSLIWQFLLSPVYGPANQILALLHLMPDATTNWLNTPELAMPSVLYVNIWRSFPFYTIVLLAGLVTVPHEWYEAAQLDGSGAWHSFLHITLPSIRSVSLVVIALHVIYTFVGFDVIYLLTGGGPVNATDVLPTLLYRSAFVNSDLGYASAIGVAILVMLLVAIGTPSLRLMRGGSEL